MTPVGKALWFIESHFAEPLSLEAVATAAGLSRFGLARAFGHATGHSVAGYWRARRLSEAARALAAGAPDILGVALDAGYNSHEAFTRAFRDQFGKTPESVRTGRTLETLTLLEPIRMYDPPPSTLAEPRFARQPAMRVAGLKESFPFSDTAGIPALWQRFGPYLETLPRKSPGHAYGICLPESGERFGYMAAAEVAGSAELPAELTGLAVPAAAYAVFRHEGHVSGIHATCAAIFDRWLPASGRRLAEGPVSMIEHYGERFDPRTGMGGLEIWIPLAE